MKQNFPKETIDPRLMKYLELLREAPDRDPELAEKGRLKFLADLQTVLPAEAEGSGIHLPMIVSEKVMKMRRFMMSIFSKRIAAVGLAVIFLVAVFLFGGASITARASQQALPGDALYSVKTSLEQARLSLSNDLSWQTELYLEFAGIRLDEISKLIQAGRYEDAIALSKVFHLYIDKALETAGQLSAIDPAKAAKLTEEINNKLTEYTQELSGLLMGLPAAIQAQFQTNLADPAIDTPASENENTNENTNENGNVNDNSNENSNEDANLNENDNDQNSNETENENDQIGENENGNQNSNENENGDLDGQDEEINGNDNEQGIQEGNQNESVGNDNEGQDNGSGSGGEDNSNSGGEHDSNENEGNSNESGDGAGVGSILQAPQISFWFLGS